MRAPSGGPHVHPYSPGGGVSPYMRGDPGKGIGMSKASRSSRKMDRAPALVDPSSGLGNSDDLSRGKARVHRSRSVPGQNGLGPPTFSHSETIPTTNYEDSASENTKKRERFNRIFSKLTNKRHRVEVYSRTWAAWFPCVVRPHSQTSGTVVVVYHNGSDTVVKLLDPESPLIRVVQGPVYGVHAHSVEQMYLNLCLRIRRTLPFREVKVGGMFGKRKKTVHSCFSGRDLVTWLRELYLGANVIEEDGVMAQFGCELLSKGLIVRKKPPPRNAKGGDKEMDSERSNPDRNNASNPDVPASPSLSGPSERALAEKKDEDDAAASEDAMTFVPRHDHLYALQEESVLPQLVQNENPVALEQRDRLHWVKLSSLEVYSASTGQWELATVVATLDPWLLLVYGQDAQAARAKWIHRLDTQTVRHPRRFWRKGSQVWVFSRGDDQWYAGVVSKRETRSMGEFAAPQDEPTVSVTYGPTDGTGSFTRAKPLKVDSEHIRHRVTRLSRLCIRVKVKRKPLVKLETEEIKRRMLAYSTTKRENRDMNSPSGQANKKTYREVSPDPFTVLLVCPYPRRRSISMTIDDKAQEARILTQRLGREVTVEVIPWEIFTAGRDVLYKLPAS